MEGRPRNIRGLGDTQTRDTAEVLRAAFERPHGITDGIPNQDIITFGARVVGWEERIRASPEEADIVVGKIHSLFATYEARFPGVELWDRSRAATAIRLVEHNLPQPSAEIMAGMSDLYIAAEASCIMAGQFSDGKQGRLLAAIQHELLLRELDRIEPGRAMLFRRNLRNFAIATMPAMLGDPSLNEVDEELAAGNPDYDPVQDWVEIQSAVMPEARWDELGPYTADASLWGGDKKMPLRYRQHIAYNVAVQQHGFAHLTVLKSKELAAVKQVAEKWETILPDAPIWDLLRFTMAMSLFEHGHPNRGHALAHTVTRPVVMGHVVDALLREGQPDQARRLVTEIPDPDVIVGTLLAAPWPQRAANTIFDELFIAQNKHHPDLRAACMRSLADIYQAQGRATDAAYMRGRADLVERQVRIGYLRYKAPKR